ADRVGRVNPSNQPAGVLAAGGDRRQRQREARPPQAGRRQDGPEAAHQVELEGVPGAGRRPGDDRPVGERLRDHDSGPGDGRGPATPGPRPAPPRPGAARRARRAPCVLPIPTPIRNTARISEKVYTVPPSINESRRVQTTSAPSADIPERAIVRYTAQAPAARPAIPFGAGSAGTSYRAEPAARTRAIAATVTLRAKAT